MYFQEKSKPSFWGSWTVLIIGIAVLVLLVISLVKLIPKSQEAIQSRNAVRDQYQAMEAQNKALVERLDLVQSERGKEQVLREKFNVVKPGEEVVIIIPSEENNTVMEDVSPTKTQSFLSKIKNFLK